MVSAVLAIVFGVTPWLVPMPVVVPVLGLALGLNSLVKERRSEKRNRRQRVLAFVGTVTSGLTTVLVLVGTYLGG